MGGCPCPAVPRLVTCCPLSPPAAVTVTWTTISTGTTSRTGEHGGTKQGPQEGSPSTLAEAALPSSSTRAGAVPVVGVGAAFLCSHCFFFFALAGCTSTRRSHPSLTASPSRPGELTQEQEAKAARAPSPGHGAAAAAAAPRGHGQNVSGTGRLGWRGWVLQEGVSWGAWLRAPRCVAAVPVPTPLARC